MQIGQTAVVQKLLQMPLVTITYDPKSQKFEYSPAVLRMVKHETMISGFYVAMIVTSHVQAQFLTHVYLNEETTQPGMAVMIATDPAVTDNWVREGMLKAAEDLLAKRQLNVVVPLGLDGKPVREVSKEMATKAREMIVESMRVEHKREQAEVTPTGEPKLPGDVGIGMTKLAAAGAGGAKTAAAAVAAQTSAVSTAAPQTSAASTPNPSPIANPDI